MMRRISSITCAIFLLIQLRSLTVTRAFHDIVNVKIKNGEEIIHLNWRRTGGYLANRNLPVWYAEKQKEPHLMPEIMAELGDFIAYHDVERSSAVIYLKKSNSFYGVIDKRFYVRGLPLNYLETNIYCEVGNYVIARKRSDNDRHSHRDQDLTVSNIFTVDEITYINSIIDFGNVGSALEKITTSSHQNQHVYYISSSTNGDESLAKSQGEDQNVIQAQISPSKILYPEILVFITNDIFKKFLSTKDENPMSSLVLYYITYFNAIDMLLVKLATEEIAIHINIAGLVIETQHKVFPYHLQRCKRPNTERIFFCYNGYSPVFSFPRYLKKYKDIFVEDSFDFFFISTNHVMLKGNEKISGKSSPVIDIYKQRMHKRFNNHLLGSVVHSKEAYSDYIIGAHHIAQLMEVGPGLIGERLHVGNEQCHVKMLGSERRCWNCLKWSKQSQNELRSFVRSNRNHCFLLNYPRSLHPYGQPVVSLDPEDQCQCYNYPQDTLNPFYMMSIPPDSCDKQIQCSYIQNPKTLTPYPLDGTPCGRDNKVCWRKKCTEIIQSSNTCKLSIFK